MAVLGLLAGTVGMDPISGEERFTYGTLTLRDGFGLVPVPMGLFGIAEVLENLVVLGKQSVYETKIQGLLPNRQDWRDSAAPIARGSALGFFLGILPGPGPVIASFVSYAMEKRLSRYPEKFGTGVIEGVAGPEAANNAATAGSFIPLLSLGIPTSAMMALFMGALMIHGIQPGPLFIAKYPELFWGFIASMYVGNAMLLVLNLPLIGIWVRLLKTPYAFLPVNITFLLDRRLQPQRQRRRDRHHARLRRRRLRPAPGRLRRRAVHPRHGPRADHGDIFAPDVADLARQFLHFSDAADLRGAVWAHGGVSLMAVDSRQAGRRAA
jgi:putative tricarboxylic transport membrane protein